MSEDLKPKPESDDDVEIIDTTIEGGGIAIVGLDPSGEGLVWRMARKFEYAEDQADREGSSEDE
jgi:hypothetical protein